MEVHTQGVYESLWTPNANTVTELSCLAFWFELATSSASRRPVVGEEIFLLLLSVILPQYISSNWLRHHWTIAMSTLGRRLGLIVWISWPIHMHTPHHTLHSQPVLSVVHRLSKTLCLRTSTCVQVYLYIVTIGTIPFMKVACPLSFDMSLVQHYYVIWIHVQQLMYSIRTVSALHTKPQQGLPVFIDIMVYLYLPYTS